MSEYNITNADSMVGRFHKWARILSLCEPGDKAKVEILDGGLNPTGEIYDNVLFHYHCTPTTLEIGGTSEHAASAFDIGDIVVLRFDEGTPRIVSRKFGLAECSEISGFLEVRRGGLPTRCVKPVFLLGYYYGNPRFLLYDIYNESLEDREAQIVAVSHHAAVMHKGLMYVLGGSTSSGVTSTYYAYNPQTDIWRILGFMPGVRFNHSAAVWGNSIYVLGGTCPNPNPPPTYLVNNTFWRCRLDNIAVEHFTLHNPIFTTYLQHSPIIPRTLTVKYTRSDRTYTLWDTGEGLSDTRTDSSIQTSIDLVTAGGSTKLTSYGWYSDERAGAGWVRNYDREFYLNLFYTPKPVDIEVKYEYATWSSMPNAPFCVTGHTAVVIGDKMYVYGGEREDTPCGEGNPPVRDNKLYSFDFLTNTWAQLQDCPFHPNGCVGHIGLTDGERMYIFGGYDGSSCRDELLMYDGSWHLISHGPRGLSDAAGVIYGSKIYIFSGIYQEGGSYLVSDKMYVYDLESGTWSTYDFTDMCYHTAVVRAA